MEIKNEKHAQAMLLEWRQLPIPAQKREIRIAIDQLELSEMYYEQKGNTKGTERTKRCARILAKYYNTLD